MTTTSEIAIIGVGIHPFGRTSVERPLVPGTTSQAAGAAYEAAGIGPEDIEVAQVPNNPKVAAVAILSR